MPEDDLDSEKLPEKTGSNPLADDTNGTSLPALETSLGEKIRAAGDAVFSKIGITRKRGRPKNCAGCGKPETKCACQTPGAAVQPPGAAVASPVGDPVSSPAVPVAAVDNSLLTDAIISGVKGALGFLRDLCRSKIKKADLDTPIMQQALREAEPDAESLAGFSKSLEAVMKKRNINSEYAPEIALGVYSVRLASPFVMLLATLNGEIAKKERLAKGGAK